MGCSWPGSGAPLSWGLSRSPRCPSATGCPEVTVAALDLSVSGDDQRKTNGPSHLQMLLGGPERVSREPQQTAPQDLLLRRPEAPREPRLRRGCDGLSQAALPGRAGTWETGRLNQIPRGRRPQCCRGHVGGSLSRRGLAWSEQGSRSPVSAPSPALGPGLSVTHTLMHTLMTSHSLTHTHTRTHPLFPPATP